MNKIIHGDCREVLKGMEAESIDSCITSPPYYGLRAYQTEPQVWGGVEGCKHEWGNKIIKKTSDNYNKGFNERWGNSPGQKKQEKSSYGQLNQGNFCLKCSAWRGELGLEPEVGLYIDHLMAIFTEVKRVLKKTGTLWVVIDDSHGGSGKGSGGEKQATNRGSCFEASPMKSGKSKSLLCIPDRFKVAMVDSGWICRNEIIWHKPSCMPESCKDRFTIDFEKVYFFSRSGKYYFKQQFENAIDEESYKGRRPRYDAAYDRKFGHSFTKIPKGKKYEKRNARAVWSINPLDTSKPAWFEHYATFPVEIVHKCLDAGCPPRGVVCDIFMGSGTVAQAAAETNRQWIGIDLDPASERMTEERVGLLR